MITELPDIAEGDHVRFACDMRREQHVYYVIKVWDGCAFLIRTEFERVDYVDRTWQPLLRLRVHNKAPEKL